ncbi:MAG: hypothetical protein ACPG05_03370 [Bdellovibrionales bacterium]
MNNTQKGNVLFLILIAVVLFAALSYAVTQSTRGGGDTSEETVGFQVAELQQVVANVRTAILRLKMNGCSNEEISVYSTMYAAPAGFDNVNTPVAGGDFSCHIFHPDGGGVTYFREDKRDICIPTGCDTTVLSVTGNHSVVNVGTSLPELMYFVDRVTDEFCEAWNEEVGVGTPIPQDNARIVGADHWSGTFDDGSPSIIGDQATELEGLDMGCFFSTTENVNNFYAVLIER